MSTLHLLAREREIVKHLRANPGVVSPEDALSAVVWPSPEFAAQFPAIAVVAPREGACAGCGGDLNARMRGCRTCHDRHKARKRYARMRVESV